MPKITDPGYGDLTAYVASFLLIGHDPTEGSPADQTKRLALDDLMAMVVAEALVFASADAILEKIPVSGQMLNGKLSVTVVSNDLIVALKTLAGTDPSATNPVYVNINGTVRTVIAATSFTLADATNWFSAGSAELATKLLPYFTYAVWDSNSSIVALSAARIPHGRKVSDFNSTSTHEKYLANYANFTSTDDLVNIGYFEATLSAGAGYTWTVPTFTNLNLRHEPTFASQLMSWTPVHTRTGGAYSNAPTVSHAIYQIIENRMKVYERHTQNATPGSSGNQQFTLPFSNSAIGAAQDIEAMNGTAVTMFKGSVSDTSNTVTLYKYDGTSEATASNVYRLSGELFI